MAIVFMNSEQLWFPTYDLRETKLAEMMKWVGEMLVGPHL